MDTPAPAPSRNAYLDHIRIFLTVMVILVHAAITYGAIGGWYASEVRTQDLPRGTLILYVLFNAGNQSYFMGFFFLMAGYFTPGSLDRKGMGRFATDRLIRLGLPLALFALLLHPITCGMGEVLKGTYPFASTVKWIYAHGNFGVGPLWFAEALLIFTGVFLLWRKFRPAANTESRPLPGHVTLLAAAIVTGLFAFALRLWVPVGQNVFGMQLGFFASYIVLFFTGCCAARNRWLERVELRHALPWMIATLVTWPLIVVAFGSCPNPALVMGGANRYALFYAMWEPFVAWGVILGFLYLGRRFLNRTNAFFAELARSSFAAYVIHAPILVGVSLALKAWQAPSLEKWLVAGMLSTVFSFALGSALSRLPGLSRIFR